MELAEAFAPGVDPQTFFEENLAALLSPYLERFDEVSEAPLVFAARLMGSGGGEWTVTVDEDGVEVEEGEGFEEPLVTLVGEAKHWDLVREQLHGWAQRLQALINEQSSQSLEPRYRVTERRLKALRRLRGKLVVTVEGVPQAPGPLTTTLLINSFVDEGARPLEVRLSHDHLVDVLEGRARPDDLYRSGKVRVMGDVGLPMQIVGAFMAY